VQAKTLCNGNLDQVLSVSKSGKNSSRLFTIPKYPSMLFESKNVTPNRAKSRKET
jgi:hypothetical protein